jgi:hypothetical protein
MPLSDAIARQLDLAGIDLITGQVHAMVKVVPCPKMR